MVGLKGEFWLHFKRHIYISLVHVALTPLEDLNKSRVDFEMWFRNIFIHFQESGRTRTNTKLITYPLYKRKMYLYPSFSNFNFILGRLIQKRTFLENSGVGTAYMHTVTQSQCFSQKKHHVSFLADILRNFGRVREKNYALGFFVSATGL